MDSEFTLQSVNQFAPQYDDYIKNCNWQGPDLFYNWLKPHLKPGLKLLDIGIGTGLSSILYRPDEIEIYGIDGSEEMIKISSDKGFAKELKQIDISSNQLWFENIWFDFAIAHAVFHLVGNLEQVVKNTSTSLVRGGYFVFTYEEMTEEFDCYQPSIIQGIYERINQPSLLKVFRHSNSYIAEILSKNSFEIEQIEQFLAFIEPNTKTRTFYQAVIARKL